MHNHHPVTRIVLPGMGGCHLSLRRPPTRLITWSMSWHKLGKFSRGQKEGGND